MPTEAWVVDPDAAARRRWCTALHVAGWATRELAELDGAACAFRPPALLVWGGLAPERLAEVAATLRGHLPRPLLLAVTARPHQAAALAAGADDCCASDDPPDLLAARARRLLGLPVACGPLRLGPVELDVELRLLRHGGNDVELTPGEAAVLMELMRRPGRPVPKPALLQRVWGYAGPSTAASVEVCVSRLRRKLAAVESPYPLRTIRGAGYFLAVEPGARAED